MHAQVWVSVVSVVGVLLGGVLSYLVQVTVQRRAERTEQRRQERERSEARRVERLELVREFIRVAQRAERAAEDRALDPPDWRQSGLDVLDELWVCERMIHVLFASDLHALARDYVRALDHVMWRDLADETLWDHLRGPKVAFLDAARDQLGG